MPAVVRVAFFSWIFTGHDSVRGSDHEVLNTSRVGPSWARVFWKCHGLDLVGSGRLEVSRVGVGSPRPDPTGLVLYAIPGSDPTREKP